MRIYVEYDTNNPDLVRVRDRNASLAIIPAGSIAVVGWLIAVVLLAGLAFLERRLARWIHRMGRQAWGLAGQRLTEKSQSFRSRPPGFGSSALPHSFSKRCCASGSATRW